MSLGSNLKQLREAAGHTNAAAFARKIGVTPGTLGDWEAGTYTRLRLDSLLKICIAIPCRVEDLIEGVDDTYNEVVKTLTDSIGLKRTGTPSTENRGQTRTRFVDPPTPVSTYSQPPPHPQGGTHETFVDRLDRAELSKRAWELPADQERFGRELIQSVDLIYGFGIALSHGQVAIVERDPSIGRVGNTRHGRRISGIRPAKKTGGTRGQS